MHFHLRGEKKVEKEGSSVQEQQRFQEQKNALTAYPYPALSKGILRPPKTRRTGKENQHNPLTEPLPNASAEALRLEAAGDSAPKCRSVPSSLGYSQCFTLTLPCPSPAVQSCSFAWTGHSRRTWAHMGTSELKFQLSTQHHPIAYVFLYANSAHAQQIWAQTHS